MTPRISFLIGGAQKAGTTALSAAISRHPSVGLPLAKEAHVFDAPDFDSDHDPEGTDERFSVHFSKEIWRNRAVRLGDATPITLFHEVLIARAARYNPKLRWIVLLRDPIDRAISQWHMERGRGNEHWPLWAAFIAESWRIRGHEADFSDGSPLRNHSYLARGRYRQQCRALYGYFPREQILLLRSEDVATHPAETLRAIWTHLDLPSEGAPLDIPRIFEGGYRSVSRWHPARWIARLALARDDPWSFMDKECRRA